MASFLSESEARPGHALQTWRQDTASTARGPAGHPLQRTRFDVGEWPLVRPSPPHPGALRRRRRRGSRLLRWAQSLFLLAGLLGAGYCGWYYAQGRIYQAYENWRFDQMVQHRSASVKAFLSKYVARLRTIHLPRRTPSAVSEPPTVTPSSSSHPPAIRESPPRVPEGTLLGRVKIPRVGLSTVVLEGVDEEVLRKGLGHIPNSALPGAGGNVAIAGHRDTFFRALKDIHTNDTILLDTTNGTYKYRVEYTEIVAPSDTEVLAATSRPKLTLVTCYPFYFVGPAPQRFIVHARQVDPIGSDDRAASSPHAVASDLRSDAGVEMNVAYRPPSNSVVPRVSGRAPARRAVTLPRNSAAFTGSAELSKHTRPTKHIDTPEIAHGSSSSDGPVLRRASQSGAPEVASLPPRGGRPRTAVRHVASWLRGLPKHVTGN